MKPLGHLLVTLLSFLPNIYLKSCLIFYAENLHNLYFHVLNATQCLKQVVSFILHICDSLVFVDNFMVIPNNTFTFLFSYTITWFLLITLFNLKMILTFSIIQNWAIEGTMSNICMFYNSVTMFPMTLSSQLQATSSMGTIIFILGKKGPQFDQQGKSLTHWFLGILSHNPHI